MSDSTTESSLPDQPADEQRFGNSPREFSGTKLVIGLFALASVMSAVLWTYWYLHTRPFQPLQLAINREFPKSYPQVQGGQLRMHQNTPRILRVTLQVPFDPEPREADERVEERVDRLEDLARQHIQFQNYELFEVHLVQRRPEHTSRKRTVTREITRDGPTPP